ncbi:hypothetical protein ACFFHH_24610 [Cytobacillus solani]|nr:hypothetical protein [Cytobacillus solani]
MSVIMRFGTRDYLMNIWDEWFFGEVLNKENESVVITSIVAVGFGKEEIH